MNPNPNLLSFLGVPLPRSDRPTTKQLPYSNDSYSSWRTESNSLLNASKVCLATGRCRRNADLRSGNCKWYFGHEVQVITFYKDNVGWCVVVVPAQSTRVSASEGRGNSAIHLYGCSKKSLYDALEGVQWQTERSIGKSFQMGDGNGSVIADDSKAHCICRPPAPSPPVAEQESKIRDLEARLQRVEKDLIEIAAPIEGSSYNVDNPDQPCSAEIGPMLQRIERTLEAVEQRLDSCRVETPANTSLADSSHQHPTNPVPDSLLSTPKLVSYGIQQDSETEIPTLDLIMGQQPRSTALSSHLGGDFDGSNSGTAITPTATTTERSTTPRTGPDEAAELNRDLMREEINRALAGVMVSLAGLLGRGVA